MPLPLQHRQVLFLLELADVQTVAAPFDFLVFDQLVEDMVAEGFTGQFGLLQFNACVLYVAPSMDVAAAISGRMLSISLNKASSSCRKRSLCSKLNCSARQL